jgi:hypothetical protein
MSRKPSNPIVRTVTDRLRERDRLEMRAVNALLSAVEPKRRRPQRPHRRSNTNRTR